MYPLTADELGQQFNLQNSLLYGHLPSIYSEENNEYSSEYLNSYISTYLKEEVLQEGLTRNLEAYARFLQMASFSQGETLNISEVARECGLNRKLVESYFIILLIINIIRLITRVDQVFSNISFFPDTGNHINHLLQITLVIVRVPLILRIGAKATGQRA